MMNFWSGKTLKNSLAYGKRRDGNEPFGSFEEVELKLLVKHIIIIIMRK